jgi:hypothetical protein
VVVTRVGRLLDWPRAVGGVTSEVLASGGSFAGERSTSQVPRPVARMTTPRPEKKEKEVKDRDWRWKPTEHEATDDRMQLGWSLEGLHASSRAAVIGREGADTKKSSIQERNSAETAQADRVQ